MEHTYSVKNIKTSDLQKWKQEIACFLTYLYKNIFYITYSNNKLTKMQDIPK